MIDRRGATNAHSLLFIRSTKASCRVARADRPLRALPVRTASRPAPRDRFRAHSHATSVDACSDVTRVVYWLLTSREATQGAPVMVLQSFAPFCLLAATRAPSVEMRAEESVSTSTTGRGS